MANAATPTEAVQALNSQLFNLINVHYNTGRKKPNQSPSESIEQSRATCTGLSIILVDACRSVGVAARVVGTPLWANKRGNHTWTEIWDDGWHFTGSDEYNASGRTAAGSSARHRRLTTPTGATRSTPRRGNRYPFPDGLGHRGDTGKRLRCHQPLQRQGSGDNVEDDVFVRVRDGGKRIEVQAELLDAKYEVLPPKTKADALTSTTSPAQLQLKYTALAAIDPGRKGETDPLRRAKAAK